MEVCGQTLLGRTVESCRTAGVERILVVTGFRSNLVEAEVRRISQGDVETVFNSEWHRRNGLSVYACADRIDEPFALMMADHVFDPSILEDLLAISPPNGSVVLAVDRKVDSIFDIDDATKVFIEDERIVEISKQLESYNAIDCGLFSCTSEIFAALERASADTGDCSLSQGMEIIAERGKFLPFDIGERWWQDVDTPEMLHYALQMLDGVQEAEEVRVRVAR
jgi:choline kinase